MLSQGSMRLRLAWTAAYGIEVLSALCVCLAGGVAIDVFNPELKMFDSFGPVARGCIFCVASALVFVFIAVLSSANKKAQIMGARAQVVAKYESSWKVAELESVEISSALSGPGAPLDQGVGAGTARRSRRL